MCVFPRRCSVFWSLFFPPARRHDRHKLSLRQVPACCWAMGFGYHHGNPLKATGWEGSAAMHFYRLSSRSNWTLLYRTPCTFWFRTDCWMSQWAACCVREVGGFYMQSFWKESLLHCHEKTAGFSSNRHQMHIMALIWGLRWANSEKLAHEH